MVLTATLFAIAALGGLTMGVLRLRQRALPLALSLVHGAVAASGLVSLIVTVAGGGAPPLAKPALALFVLAALGGFYLFSFRFRNRPVPVPAMAVHALVAVAGFVLLLLPILAGASARANP